MIHVDNNGPRYHAAENYNMENDPEIFIWRNGKKEGPFSPRVLDGAIRIGSIPAKTPSWTKSAPDWTTAAEILKRYPSPVLEHIQPTPSPRYALIPHQKLQKYSKLNQAWLCAGVGLVFIVGLIILGIISHHNGWLQASTNRQTDGETTGAAEHREPVVDAKAANSVQDSEHCVLMAHTENGSGTAFIALENGVAYVYTNVHVASAKNLVFSDFSGRQVPVDKHGEVVDSTTDEPGTDIVRFPLLEPPRLALTFASRSRLEQKPEVWALGDSGGESILKTLKGRVKGVGPSKIEVDCEFVPGNSGGPIVTAAGEVVGIASYMIADRSIWAKGTEQEVRRIGWIPGKKFHWTATSSAALDDERTSVMHCMDTSKLLFIIGLLEAGKTGFTPPKKMPVWADKVLATTGNHPLCMGIDETNVAIRALAKGGDLSWSSAHREYVRFLNACATYQKQQLGKADNTVKSSFWKNALEENMQVHREVLENFQGRLKQFIKSGSEGVALSDS